MLELPDGFYLFYNSKKEELKLEMYKAHIIDFL